MTHPKSGAQISAKAFIQAVAIIFVLMMVSGILTRIIPAGNYARVEIDGREAIDPTSFTLIERPDFRSGAGSRPPSRFSLPPMG
jgi:uncharacterized ion transporter superfamily protein YfcC